MERVHTHYHYRSHSHESDMILNRLKLAWWIRVTPGRIGNCGTIDGEAKLALGTLFLMVCILKIFPFNTSITGYDVRYCAG